MREGGDTAFIIGGADGIDESLKQQAHDGIRLSSLTLPHAMARLILCEQLYRAVSVVKNHPYHQRKLTGMPISFINQRNPRLYLASRSPRRRELLTQIGVQFDTIVFRDPPREDKELDETPLAGESAVAYVERVARAKAEHGWRIVGWRKLVAQPILSADTALNSTARLSANQSIATTHTPFCGVSPAKRTAC